jgi:hypothetical protein
MIFRQKITNKPVRNFTNFDRLTPKQGRKKMPFLFSSYSRYLQENRQHLETSCIALSLSWLVTKLTQTNSVTQDLVQRVKVEHIHEGSKQIFHI